MKMGPWEGLSEQKVIQKFPREWKIWNSKPSELKMTGRETLNEIQGRVLQAVKKIYDRSESLKILAVTHVALIRVLIIHYNRLCLDDYRKIDIPNASVYFLNKTRQSDKIVRVL